MYISSLLILSTSIYHLVLIYVCHFHRILQSLFKFDHYPDTRAFILEPWIQGIYLFTDWATLKTVTEGENIVLLCKTEEHTNHIFTWYKVSTDFSQCTRISDFLKELVGSKAMCNFIFRINLRICPTIFNTILNMF